MIFTTLYIIYYDYICFMYEEIDGENQRTCPRQAISGGEPGFNPRCINSEANLLATHCTVVLFI